MVRLSRHSSVGFCLHLQGKSIFLDQSGHLVVAERHAQRHAIAARRHLGLPKQLRQILILLFRLILLIDERKL